MANFNGVQQALIASGLESAAAWSGGRVRSITDTIVYNTQVAGSTLTMGYPIPAGALIQGIWLNTDTSTATATLAFGTAASSALFAAAAAYTTVNTWVPVAKASSALAVLTAQTQLVILTAAASLPAAGNLIVTIEYTLD